MAEQVWTRDAQSTIPQLFEHRLERDPDGEYLDLGDVKLSASRVVEVAGRLGGALVEFGTVQHGRVATLLENSAPALLAWAGTVLSGRVAVPINAAYKGEYLRHQLTDSGSTVLVVARSLLPRVVEIAEDLPELAHVIVVDDCHDDADLGRLTHAAVHRWHEVLDGNFTSPTVDVKPSDMATFIYTGGTTGLSKGCMLSHNYHEALATQIGICWGRTEQDVVWTPLPLYHFNALTTVVIGTLVYGGRGAIYRRFSVSQFWPEMNRVGATITSTLGTMAYLLAHDIDRPEMPLSGTAQANKTLRTLAAAPMPVEVDQVIRTRFGVTTFSGAYGVTEASLVSWQPPGSDNRPYAAGIVNDSYFDVRIFDDADNELPAGTDGEIVLRPKRPHVMFEGYWGDPEATVGASRNWWYHTGDIGRVDSERYLYFVDRKADYLRRRGENIASFEVERVLMGHGSLADVAVHAIPSGMTEDDLKITGVVKANDSLSESDLFLWCVDRLPYFALPRYIEFRAELPRSPVGRVLKRELRDEGVTGTTWDVEASTITYEKR